MSFSSMNRCNNKGEEGARAAPTLPLKVVSNQATLSEHTCGGDNETTQLILTTCINKQHEWSAEEMQNN